MFPVTLNVPVPFPGLKMELLPVVIFPTIVPTPFSVWPLCRVKLAADTSKVALPVDRLIEELPAIDPLPDNTSVPALMVVEPVYVLLPLRIWLDAPVLVRERTDPAPFCRLPLKVVVPELPFRIRFTALFVPLPVVFPRIMLLPAPEEVSDVAVAVRLTLLLFVLARASVCVLVPARLTCPRDTAPVALM